MKKFNMHKYDGLWLSKTFVEMSQTEDGRKKLQKCFNGVGSRVGFWNRLFYHLIPNTVWGLDITAASDPHDADYTYPKHFRNRQEALAHKAEADDRLETNIEIYGDMHKTWEWLDKLRHQRAREYHFIVSHLGEESFLQGKTFDEPETKLNLKTVLKWIASSSTRLTSVKASRTPCVPRNGMKSDISIC